MNNINNKLGALDSFYRERISNSFNSNPLKSDGLKLRSLLTKDTISFTSLNNPTKREQKEIAEINRLFKQGLTNSIRAKTKDTSTLVRLKAYESIKELDPFEYTRIERKRLEAAQKLALKDIKKYDNGKDIQGFINELEKQGFKFYFADDILPKDLWTDEDFLDSWKWDDEDIEIQLEKPIPISVNEVLKTKGSAEIHYNRKNCKAMLLFNQKNPKPESFWHEWFHYCQKRAGMFEDGINKTENAGSAFAKREMETYQFIIDNRNLLNTLPSAIKLDIAIWNSYKKLYNYERGEMTKEITNDDSNTANTLGLNDKLSFDLNQLLQFNNIDIGQNNNGLFDEFSTNIEIKPGKILNHKMMQNYLSKKYKVNLINPE